MITRHTCGALAVALAALVASTALAAAGEQPLIDAVRIGDRAAVQRLLGTPGAVNVPEADGTTALHAAVWLDEGEIVGTLLRAGADVNAANRYGVTALSIASLNGNAAIARMLLEAGSDPNARLAEDQTALMAAARAGSTEVVRLLLEAGAEVNARERVLGETALMWAALEDHPETLRLLAAHGADLNATSNATAFPRFKFGDGIVARPTVLPKGGWTPLMYAARQNAVAAAGALIDAGADPNLTDPDGTSALVFAIINAHFDLATVLVEKGADPNVADVTGMTPLYAAVDMHTLDDTVGRPNPRPHSRVDAPGLVRILLAHGADPNARQKSPVLERVHNDGDPTLGEGATPLMRAAKDADVTLMRILLDQGADPTLRTKTQRTVLMYAASRQSGFRGTPNRGTEQRALEAIALCVQRGADVNAVDETGQTAMHLAVGQAEESVIRLLLEAGADLHLRDKRGRRPIEIVQGGGRGVQGRAGRVALLEELMTKAAAPAPPR